MSSKHWVPLPRTPGTTDSPCYGCEDRHVGCHAECEKYQAWAERQERLREEDQERRNGEIASWSKHRHQRKLKWERNHNQR